MRAGSGRGKLLPNRMQRSSSAPPPFDPDRFDEIPAGTILGDRYRIDGLIGQGGMGKVYAAEHVLLRKRQAIKVLRGARALVPEVAARFEREAMAAANIEHPNIAAANDFGRLPDGSLYLALEYVEGKNLRDELDEGPFAIERSLHIARQIASALAAAQELAIVHRDLKPENIMLIERHGDSDFVKVLDFGIARVPMAERPGQPLTQTGVVFGTPEYMAPEQALGQLVDGRADLFALGVILFEMIAGVRPYDDAASNLPQRVTARPPRLQERVPGLAVPPAIERIVSKLLAPSVSERFQNAKQVLAELSSLLGSPDSTSPPPKPVPPTPITGTPPTRLSTFLPGDPLPSFDLEIVERKEDEALPGSDLLSTNSLSTEAQRPEPRTLLRQEPPPPALESDQSSLEGLEEPSVSERAPSPPLGESLSLKVQRIYAQACRFIDLRRESLPRVLRRTIKSISAGTLLAAFSGLLLLTLGILALSFGALERRPESAAPDPKPSALPARRAVREAPESSAVAAEPAPDGPEELLALAVTEVGAGRESEAVSAVSSAIAIDDRVAQDPRAAALLTQALRAKSKAVHEEAFALLEGRMGAAGADALYDLTLDPATSQAARERALAWLKTKAFEKVSSPALYSAVKLRQAASCQQKHHLLLLAGNVGGQRTLEVLRGLEKRVECKPASSRECYPCLGEDTRLKEALAKVEKRVRTESAPKR